MMIASHLKVALRSLIGSKLYAAINLLGLALGLAATLLIGLFVLDELGYDRHFADADRIYRVSRSYPQQNLLLAANAPQVAPLLKQDFPGIAHVARLFGGQALLGYEELSFYEDAVRFVDHEFFAVFDFAWLQGDSATALTRPFTVVLTESMARKYFGSTNPLGQSLLLENQVPLEVTGVIADLPHHTHLALDVAISLETLPPIVGRDFLENWGSNNFHTYIKLEEGVAIDAIAGSFDDFLDRHLAENSAGFTRLDAQAMTDIHLRSGRQFELAEPGSITNVYAFSAAALFILAIACVNFMNLATARATRRGREVGVRKSLGASRQQLLHQFFGESLLMTLFAAVLALMLVELALPSFNAFLGKTLSLGAEPRILILTGLLVLLVGSIAGSYPALYLSAFKPVQVLRGTLARTGSLVLRNTLVVLQFAVAIVLLVATLVVGLQQRFAGSIELGFEREQVLVLHGSPTIGFGEQWESLRQELLRHPDILGATLSAQTPLEMNTSSVGLSAEGQSERSGMPVMQVDYDFFTTYGIALLAGRGFSADFPADRALEPAPGLAVPEAGYVLNRLAVEQLGWTPEEAIGKTLAAHFNNGAPHPGRVVGVVENSYFESVHANLKPMVFLMPELFHSGTATMDEASLRLSGRNMAEVQAHVAEVWQRFLPQLPLDLRFLDERYTALHRAEARQGVVFRAFAVLAIVIACLGLYGLAAFNAERRRKEIGVRKVMGGSVWQIVLLLTNDFSRLVLIANVIAWPLAWVVMSRWLEQFAYRIDLTPLVFIGSGLIALCVAWVTVGGTAARAAGRKPVLALRYE